MDVVALSFEDQYMEQHIIDAEKPTDILPPSDPNHNYSDFKSLYQNCVIELRKATALNPQTGEVERWAMRFFSYDRLALVNVESFVEVGAWDTMIPFYMTDCDMHARLEMAHMSMEETFPGMVFDVASALDDLIVLYRKKGTPDASFKDPNMIEEQLRVEAEVKKLEEEEARLDLMPKVNGEGEKQGRSLRETADRLSVSESRSEQWEEDEIWSGSFQNMVRVLDDMSRSKMSNERGRNTWQGRQVGGMGEPFYRDSAGFELGIQMWIEHGKKVFAEKWGHRDCDIVRMGLKPEDAWKVEKDW